MRPGDRERLEFLAHALGDFRAFCGLVDIVPKGGGRQKLILNQIQRQYCRERTARDVVLKPRQIGFTTLEQARDIFHFLTVPGARVVTTCQSITDGSPKKLLSNNYRVMFESLRRVGLHLNFRNESGTEWTLADRDASLRIVEAGASEAAASKKGRAGTITRLHLTETAFYEYADTTLNALLECVPGEEHGSEIVSESTPNGAAGLFYKQCKAAQSGQSAYKLHFYPWYHQREYKSELGAAESLSEHPDPQVAKLEEQLRRLGVSEQQIKWYRNKIADKGFSNTAQEYPSDPDTCFLVSGQGFFDQSAVSRQLGGARDPRETRDSHRIRVFEEPQPGQEYILSVDTSEGGGGDPSAAHVLKRSDGRHVAVLDGQYPPWELARAVAALGLEYNTALIAVERNNHGHAVLMALDPSTPNGMAYPNLYEHEDGKLGWPTNSVTRPQMLGELEDAIRKDLWVTPDRLTLSQLRTFVVKNGKPQAATGEHDDLVMAAAIGWAVRQIPPPPPPARGNLSPDVAGALFGV